MRRDRVRRAPTASAPETIDLRSDTFSQPAPEMFAALRDATLGDDVYGEDPTVRALEAEAATLLGKEAGLLLTSGTQGNLVALLTHCGRGAEVLLGSTSDLFNSEAGGATALGGVLLRPLPDEDGALDPEDVDAAVRGSDIHHARSTLLCVENSHQRSGGTPVSASELAALGRVCRRRGLALHVDGARLFNAALALDEPPAETVRSADSVSFCLSKGLSCPVGAVLCGSKTFITRARRVRKMLGGGMRQAGWIAAAGRVALRHWRGWLASDHAHAARLAAGLAAHPGVRLDPAQVRTNIVYLDIDPALGPVDDLVADLATAGVRCFAMGPASLRMVTYRGITSTGIEEAVVRTLRVLASRAAGSTTP